MTEHTDYECPIVYDKPERAYTTNACMFCSKRVKYGCKDYDKIMDDWKSQQAIEFMREKDEV